MVAGGHFVQERVPLPAFAQVEADAVVGGIPQVSFAVFDDGVHLVVDERLLVAHRVFYPAVVGIPFVAHGDADGVVCHPDALFVVHVDVVDGVPVHRVVAVIVRHDVGNGFVRLCIHLVDADAIGGYQDFFLVEVLDAVDADVCQFGLDVYHFILVGLVDVYSPSEGSDEQLARGRVIVEPVDACVGVVPLLAGVQGQGVFLHLGREQSGFGADEEAGGACLFDVCDSLACLIGDGGRFPAFDVIQVDELVVAEPYFPVVVHISVADGGRLVFYLFFGQLVNQLEAVALRVIAEDASSLAYFPQIPLVVHIEPVQVYHGGYLLVPVRQFVSFEFFSVVPVDAAVGKEPHVSFVVFLDGIDLSITQSLFYADVFVDLGWA